MTGGGTQGADGRIQSVSTRIALNGAASICTDCGEEIDAGIRHKVAAVHERSRIEHYPFCDGDCLDRWRAAPPAAD